MADLTVTVKLRWEGPIYRAGPFSVGRVSKLPTIDGSPWCAFPEFGIQCTFHATEAEARAAVETAAIKALGGHADE